ncbi:hydroxymethylglutaryl-CoA lyase [Taibaiella sp. KBW10]|uniref:hydroxymethylglutaryl-CoA lyase n=1 Tax=Taibaiella sp. KBW10 TaxID=2153357 RepID=UPI000F5A2359|nr:hydroxymethylglutaryl-CoA lyase [Taibaiella sp. KBW10]RQO30857.1 hydroxymethylglutaryl-CoA lyase [Taibaiella sp. KBW10]
MILVECPRDAMQGWAHFIPTATKVAYLNQLLKVGFDILDFGSFVSAKAIPQLIDTKEVIPQLDLSNTRSKLLAIVANTRGAQEAVVYDEITYLGFPFSISETFQMRNTNKTIAESLAQVEEIQNLCAQNNKKAVLYISMGFGNPYGDEYSADIVYQWFNTLVNLGVTNIALADTVGVSNPQNIQSIYQKLIPEFPQIQIGAHFHSTEQSTEEKLLAAWEAGCTSFDTSIRGIGGCPMAKDELVGNIATEKLIAFADKMQIPLSLDREAFVTSMIMANEVFV